MTNKQIKDQEIVLNNINQSLFLIEDRIKKLGNNLILNFDNLEDNAMTVGIVGEWGSGKTSFLNILLGHITKYENKYIFNGGERNIEDWLRIENKVKEIKLHNETKIGGEQIKIQRLKVLNLNSWLINNIVSNPLFNLVQIINKELDLKISSFDDEKDNNNESYKKKITNWVKSGANNITNILENSQFLETKIGGIPKFETIYDDLVKLKESFHKELNDKLNENSSKLILIIDDLDRIPPEDAVVMLDSIKLFLDNPNVMIFLLNDKDIVQRGLKKKLGIEGEKEAEKTAKSYLDKLINIEIDIEEYYNENKFFEDIKEFISQNKFIKDISGLDRKLVNDNDILDKLYEIKNMRRIKKLFKNFQIQAPSIVEYEKDNNDDKLEKYFEYFKTMLDKYVAKTQLLDENKADKKNDDK